MIFIRNLISLECVDGFLCGSVTKIVTEMIRVLYLLHKRLVLVLKVSDLQWEQ